MDMFPNMGGGPAADAAAAADDGKDVDLRDLIETKDCYARNEAAGFPMSNLFIGDSRLGCKSDADEQLILHIAFREFVKVRKLHMHRRIFEQPGRETHGVPVLTSLCPLSFRSSELLN
jgi:hypothetical protein